MRILLFLIFTTLIHSINAQNPLFLITEKGKEGAIDSTGKVIIAPIFKTIKSFSEGLAAARLEKGNYGFIDSLGQWIIPPQYEYATYFAEGLAIVFKNGKPFYINHKGEKAFEMPENTLKATPFEHGVARIEMGEKVGYNNKMGLMNKKGQWVLKPIYLEIIMLDSNLIYAKTGKYKRYNWTFKHFYFDTMGNLITPKFNEINTYYPYKRINNKANKPHENSPLKIKKNNEQITYYNRTNNIIWQSSLNTPKIDTLDIEHFYYNSFYAFSKADECDTENSINTCTSIHYERPITKELSFPENILSLEIRTNDTVNLEGKWMGYKVFVANNSRRIYNLPTTDYRLDMTMQALNEAGKWQDIQRLRAQGCTSGGEASLIPQRYWQLEMPLFKGSFDTSLRLKLEVIKRGDKLFQIYSNEIKASINPAQFWQEKGYVLRTLNEVDEDD
jgi:hypothetical protein